MESEISSSVIRHPIKTHSVDLHPQQAKHPHHHAPLERQNCLQLPEERAPFLRRWVLCSLFSDLRPLITSLLRSTSPTIVLSTEDDEDVYEISTDNSPNSLGSSRNASNTNSPNASRRSSSSRKNSGSRKNSFVSCLSPNIRFVRRVCWPKELINQYSVHPSARTINTQSKIKTFSVPAQLSIFQK